MVYDQIFFLFFFNGNFGTHVGYKQEMGEEAGRAGSQGGAFQVEQGCRDEQPAETDGQRRAYLISETHSEVNQRSSD